MTTALAGTSKATFFTSPAKGSGVKGIELDRCYDGDYVNGRRHGYGRYTYPNSFFVYEGSWDAGEKHGLGRLSMRDGAYYEGEFVRGEMQGKGVRMFANGDQYVGTFEMGEMHGFGVMTHANGDVYQGPFDHNAFEGEGLYTFAATGDHYQGDFHAHRMSGQGTMQYANGDKYVGAWLEGKRHGEGFCTFANGNVYTGSWANNSFEGQGELQVALYGVRYQGAFQRGQPTTVPTQLNLLFDIEPDPKKKPPAKGEADLPAPLPVVPGEPLQMLLTIAAQLQEALPPAPPPPPEDPSLKGKKPAARPASAIPSSPTVITTPPKEGFKFTTAHMESGRVVNLTLHKEPPGPLKEGVEVKALICPTRMPDGQMHVRFLLLFAHVEPPLPISRVGEEVVTSLQVELAEGQHIMEGLVVGSAADAERMAVPGGVGALVGSSWGLRQGYCRITLPEWKEAKVAPGAKKK